jgi:acyl-CoA thioester hydrolase
VATWSSPVRYAEADQQGIVFNAHYLTWADEACTAWFASVGLPYAVLLGRGLDTKVVASALEWRSSARYGDVVDLDTTCERVGGTSFVLASAVRVAERLCCTVRTTYVLVDAADRPVRVPDDLRLAWGATPAAGAAPAPAGAPRP